MSRIAPRPIAKKTRKKSAKTLLREQDADARQRCISKGYCEAAGYDPLGKGMKCAGRFEWAHAKSRRFRSIRHLDENCFCLCWSHHAFFTAHPDLWTAWCEVMRPGIWERLNGILRATSKVGR